MKKITIKMPKGFTNCNFNDNKLQCPFKNVDKVCEYFYKHNICRTHDLFDMEVSDEGPSDREMLELDNTEYSYGHNITHNSDY